MTSQTMPHPCPKTAVRPARPGRLRRPLAAALLGTLGAVCACGTNDPVPQESGPDEQAASTAPGSGKLVALKPDVVIWSAAEVTARPIGWLGLGAKVARSNDPVSRVGCKGGWYAIQPRGFVCAGDDASTDLESRAAKLLGDGPSLDKPLPYRYARVRRGEGVVYRKVPSAEEQAAAEPNLGKHKPLGAERLGAGANDVPLDERGLPAGPPVLKPDGEGVGADGYRTNESFFAFPGLDEATALLKPGEALRRDGDDTQILLKGSGVAMARAFSVGEGDATRPFALLPDGRFMPIDRLVPAIGTPWHGIRLEDRSLPVAFTLRDGVVTWALQKDDRAEPLNEELEPRQPVDLTGRFRTVSSVLYYCLQTDEGPEQWVRARDIILVPKRNKYPDFATEGQKWLDISLANQSLVAYEGHKAIFATLISSGQDRLGDPAQGPATPQGVFNIRTKQVTAAIDPREVQETFTVQDAPWVVGLTEELAITGSYWLRDFGEAQSFHNVALSPVDARFVWSWSDPPVPEGWHGVIADESSETTIVYLHR